MVPNLPQLRELELALSFPSTPYRTLLSSITSTELRKIVFPQKCRRYWMPPPTSGRGVGFD